MRTLLALLVVCSFSANALAASIDTPRIDARVPDDTWREARIRPQDPRLTQLIHVGLDRSATFRDLVSRVESGNLIVYISLSPNLRSNLAGKLSWMTRTGMFRYVKVTISTEQTADQMIAALAHELQHALEVSGDESVIDQRSLAKLYKRIGLPSQAGPISGFETVAAQETGFRVRRELVASAAAASAASRANEQTQS